MKIAAMTEGPDWNSPVAETFAAAEWLLILEMEPAGVIAAIPRNGLPDCDLAREIVAHDCEAVLCGPVEEAPFVIIADEGCVTRYQAAGLSARTAVREMEAYHLSMVPDFIGGTGCGSGGVDACRGHHI